MALRRHLIEFERSPDHWKMQPLTFCVIADLDIAIETTAWSQMAAYKVKALVEHPIVHVD